MIEKKIFPTKVIDGTHSELMQLKYKLGIISASETIQYLLDFYKKKSHSLTKEQRKYQPSR